MTPWTIQSMEFSRPEYWSRKPFPSPGDLPNPGIESRSPELQADSLPAEPQGKPKNTGWVAGIFPTQESNWGLLHCRQILYQLSYQGSPKIEFNCFPKKEVSLFTVKILIYICAWKKEILYLDYSRIQIRPLVICVCTQLLSHIRLFATTMDYSLPGSSVRGIFQARILK